MEHLRDKPNNFTFNEKILLICNPFDPPFNRAQGKSLNDFAELPQRLGWKVSEDGTKEFESGNLGFPQVAQRWLYFEVLAQVFGHLPNYDARDFIHRDPSGQSYITTEKLPEYLELWLDSEKQSPAMERNRRLIRIQQVLDRVRVYVSQYCTVQRLDSNARWEINDRLALSFLVLGETLTRAQSMIQRKVRFRINGWCSHDLRNHGWGYSKLILQKLKEAGWCAKAIHMLQALLRGNTVGLIYLFSLENSSSKGDDHYICTPTECKSNDVRRQRKLLVEPAPYHHCSAPIKDFCYIEEHEYLKPGQTRKIPICTTVESFNGHVEGQELATIIDQGCIPLFRFQDRQLELVKMSQSFDKSYAIFSHVWTDGFGSLGDKNEMSLCVLNMFSKILEEITKQRAGVSSALPELFWIDTLAIPVGERFTAERIKAISQMHNIYTHASYTIVLDLSLIGVPMGSGYSSPAMKITMSRWMTRLWTLQEAVLSKNLFFVWNDRVYSMTQLEDMFAREDSELQSCVPSLSRTYYYGILGDMRLRIHDEFRKDEGWEPKSDFLAAVWKAAQWRSTAHPYHEVLSLATMLNVDQDNFALRPEYSKDSDEYQQECEDRMIKLLSRFGALSPCPIPPGMIFLPGPRLAEKGYSWAPKTWMSSCEIDSPDPLSLPDAGNTRLNQSEGLEVQFPGFMLHDLGDGRSTLKDRVNFYFSANAALSEWYRVELADDTVHFPEAEKLCERDLAIIVPRLPIVDLREIALFVAVKKTHGGIHYVEILNRVWISQEERQKELETWNEKHRKGIPEAMSAGEKLGPCEKWCVDGSSQPSVVPQDKGKQKASLYKTNSQKDDQSNDAKDPEPKRSLARRQTLGHRFLKQAGRISTYPWSKPTKGGSTAGESSRK